MSIRRVALALIAMSSILFASEAVAETTAKSSQAVQGLQSSRTGMDLYRGLKLSFEPNVGQAAKECEFVSHVAGYSLLVNAKGMVVVPSHASGVAQPMRIELVGAKADADVRGKGQLSSKTNYYVGPRSNWRIGVPQYASVSVEGIYPGIDAVYYGNERQLEYDFIVAPGASPNAIRIRLNGATLSKDDKGDIVANSQGTQIRLRRPIAYQKRGDQREAVEVAYELKGSDVQLRIGKYDGSRELVIDPVLNYASYVGGSGFDTSNAVAVDPVSGVSFITGQTCSPNLPITTGKPYQGNCDAYVMALSADHSAAVYTTYIGGSNGDNGKSIAAMGNGKVVVAGTTSSPDFPTQAITTVYQPTYAGGDNDAFVSVLDATGGLAYSTFFGGRYNDDGNGVAVDPKGDIVLAGQTNSDNLIGAGPYPAAVVATIYVTELKQPDYSTAVFSRYLDVHDDQNGKAPFVETANSVATDLLGDIFLGGMTRSGDTSKLDAHALVIKLQGLTTPPPGIPGDFVFGWMLLGGSGTNDSIGQGIAVDSTGQSVLVGKICTASGGCQNSIQDWAAFALKVNAVGSAVLWNDMFQTPSIANGVAIDSNGFIYLTGTTTALDFPTTSPTQAALAGSQDAFLMKLDHSGYGKIFSTYFGGAGSELGNGVAVTPSGDDIYVAGNTDSLDFPKTSALQGTYGGNGDGFLANWTGLHLPYVSLSTPKINFGDQVVGTTSVAQPVTVTNLGDKALQITGINANGAFKETHDCGVQLDPQASCTINVAFSPTLTGIAQGSITIVDDAASSPQTVVLSGNGTAQVITVLPGSLDFGDQAIGTTSQAAKNVVVTNTGSGTLTISSITVSGDFTQSNSCGTIAPNGSCTISVSFSPVHSGALTGTLTTVGQYSGTAEPLQQTVALAGNGTGPILTVTPTEYTFLKQVVGTSSAPITITLTNPSAVSVDLGEITGSTYFQVKDSNCTTSLAPSRTCTASVVFAPTTTGRLIGTVKFSDGAVNSPQSVALSGTGVAPVISVSVPSLGFANQLVGTTSTGQNVTVTNTGTADFSVGSITVSENFKQQNNCGATIPESGGSCIIIVSFAPSTTGSISGTLTIAGNASNSPQTVQLTGQGTTNSSGGGGGTSDFLLAASPSSNSVVAGKSASYTLTVSPFGGFKSALGFSCSGLPAGTSCSFSPATLTPDGTSPATVAVTISTQARADLRQGPFESPTFFASVMMKLPFGIFGVVFVAGNRTWKRKRLISTLVLLLALAFITGFFGCGGGSSPSTPETGSGTQVGSYTVTVTAATTIATNPTVSHTTTLTLGVN